jgi:hypothetical protein
VYTSADRRRILLSGLTLAGALTMFGGARAEAQACTPTSSTNDRHVAEGRATTSTVQSCSACLFGVCGLPSGCETSTKTYRAAGSNESLGSDGSATITLYQTGSSYSTRAPAAELSCSDKLDNDCDAKVDCADSQCSSDPACTAPVLRYVSVPGTAFSPGVGAAYTRGSAIPRSQLWTAHAPLALPDGAVVRELRCALFPESTLSANSGALIYDASLTDPDGVTESDFLDLSGPSAFTTRSVAITKLRPMDNKTMVRSLLIQLFHGKPPVDAGYTSNYVRGCTVGYTL